MYFTNRVSEPTQTKPSKSLQKKAARLEKRQQWKTSKSPATIPTSPSAELVSLINEEKATAVSVESASGQVGDTSLPPSIDIVQVSPCNANVEKELGGHVEASPSAVPPDTSTFVSPVTSGFTTPYESKMMGEHSIGQAVEDRFKSREAEKSKKRQNVVTRTIWTIIMISGFIGESQLLLMYRLLNSNHVVQVFCY
jgi:phosphatidate cytidylyltransferase